MRGRIQRAAARGQSGLYEKVKARAGLSVIGAGFSWNQSNFGKVVITLCFGSTRVVYKSGKTLLKVENLISFPFP
jgi:hypothetical protein